MIASAWRGSEQAGLRTSVRMGGSAQYSLSSRVVTKWLFCFPTASLQLRNHTQTARYLLVRPVFAMLRSHRARGSAPSNDRLALRNIHSAAVWSNRPDRQADIVSHW